MNKFEYLPKEIIKSTELTPAEKIIYLHLFHITGWKEDTTINITHLAEKLGINRKTIQRTIPHFIELNLIKINEDKTVSVFLNEIEIKDKDFYKQSITMQMLGNFIKVPTQFLYDTNLTPAERLTEMMLFGYYFDIDNKGNFKNRGNVVLETVALCYGINPDAFKKHIQNLKKKGAIDYEVKTNKCFSKIYGFKFFKQETISVYLNGKTQKSKNTVTETKEEIVELNYKEPTVDQPKEEEPVIEVNENTIPERLKMKYRNNISTWPTKDIMSWCDSNGVEYNVTGAK